MATKRFIQKRAQRGSNDASIGEHSGIRDERDYGARMNQWLRTWSYWKIIPMLWYKARAFGNRRWE
ncbi:hypothetical protein MPNT_50020 [Candidatus Methylacidithermus pantelleriae]|uniref:Uncharacterized protein n=1 Tax=Candidatus Methylacidithermus pantelleriae TaxID=2744239 RepID=A0A8J2FT80_9BACT|nr:hypothetical protein MPNT_50020 [Candidatus Methylacidithermus pantelleriae]